MPHSRRLNRTPNLNRTVSSASSPQRHSPKQKTGGIVGANFAQCAELGTQAYDRVKHLPALIPLSPAELRDRSVESSRRIVVHLRRALRAERIRGRAGHWCYDLNRHMALLEAYKAELSCYETHVALDSGTMAPGVYARTYSCQPKKPSTSSLASTQKDHTRPDHGQSGTEPSHGRRSLFSAQPQKRQNQNRRSG